MSKVARLRLLCCILAAPTLSCESKTSHRDTAPITPEESTDTETVSDPDSETESGTDSGTETDTDPHTDTDSGTDTDTEPVDPAPVYQGIETWGGISCGHELDRTLRCWPETDHTTESLFIDYSIKRSLEVCGVRTSGVIECWGVEPKTTNAGEVYTQVAVGWNFRCGLAIDGSLKCWGYNTRGQLETPKGEFIDLTAADHFACAINTLGEVECWGEAPTAPPGPFVQIDAGSDNACGVLESGALACWGSNFVGEAEPPPGNNYVKVSAGDHFACALDSAGAITCWGNDTYGQLEVPPGLYRDVAAGAGVTCALTTEGHAVCWGADHERAYPPEK